jgi:hypothetical protein
MATITTTTRPAPTSVFRRFAIRHPLVAYFTLAFALAYTPINLRDVLTNVLLSSQIMLCSSFRSPLWCVRLSFKRGRASVHSYAGEASSLAPESHALRPGWR